MIPLTIPNRPQPSVYAMREISLITGQLHRAIYNLNAQARREADQKFESGLPDAPHRALKKVFQQFTDSLSSRDHLVRQRTVAMVAKLMIVLERLPLWAQQKSIELIDTGLSDTHPLVREGPVESYSLLLANFDGPIVDESTIANSTENLEPDHLSESVDCQFATIAQMRCVRRLLELAVSDVEEIVREASAIGVGIQSSKHIQEFSCRFLLENCHHHKNRRACRAIEALAEFPSQRESFEEEVLHLLMDSDARLRRSALKCCFRLSKLDSLSLKLLEGVVRRMFDGDQEVAALADKVARTSFRSLKIKNPLLASALPACSKIALGDARGWKLFEHKLFQTHESVCRKLCSDRLNWKRRITASSQRKASVSLGSTAGTTHQLTMVELVERLRDESKPAIPQAANHRALGWVVSKFFGQLATG